MSKLSFRARALDASKPMPVFRSEEVPDLPDFAAINRGVPQMPTGMEKEEECEHHLQRAISAQQAYGHTGELVIPTPEVYQAPRETYDLLYPANYKLPRQLIHVQPFAVEHDIPDYDMDSEDEAWLEQQQSVIDLTPLKFEELMDRLEKSGSGQHVVTLKEAKLLLREDDDLTIAVYDYWLNKRLKTQHPLIPHVKTEKRDGSTNSNPYVAFRRRTEKMQTRKNRKNDEASYEKMLKLRRDLSRAVNLIELVKQREKTKHEHLKLTVDIFEKRYKIGDFNGQILAEVSALRHIKPTATYLPINHHLMRTEKMLNRPKIDESSSLPKRKREYKRRHRQEQQTVLKTDIPDQDDMYSSEDDPQHTSDVEEEDPDGPFAFRRKKGCSYHAPLIDQMGNWPWCSPHEGGLGDKRYRYCLTSLSRPKSRCIGFARRRVGRGGRIIFDRASTSLDDYWCDIDLSHSLPNGLPSPNEFISEIKNEWIHFRPKTPSPDTNNISPIEIEEDDFYDEDGNVIPVVPITSLKEYIDEDDLFSAIKPNSEIDLASFQSHQEELFEMQRKQLERLKGSNMSNNDMCNPQEHSLPSGTRNDLVLSSQTSSQSSQPLTSTLLPQALDSASVHFAVSAVHSVSEVLNSFNPDNNGDNRKDGCGALKNGPIDSYIESGLCQNESSPSLMSDAQKVLLTSYKFNKYSKNSQNDISSQESNLPASEVT